MTFTAIETARAAAASNTREALFLTRARYAADRGRLLERLGDLHRDRGTLTAAIDHLRVAAHRGSQPVATDADRRAHVAHGTLLMSRARLDSEETRLRADLATVDGDLEGIDLALDLLAGAIR